MSEKRVNRTALLVIVVLGLVALTVAVLVSLRRPQQSSASTEETAASTAESRTRIPASSAVAPARPMPAVPSVNATSAGATAVPAAEPSQHLEAPAMTPVEIAKERDPVKRAQLMKVHRLSTARVRLSLLRRRQSLLETSLSEARRNGTWSATKLQRAESQLAEIKDAVVKSEQRLQDVRQEVGGDIDQTPTP